jgi:hypothetical protein
MRDDDGEHAAARGQPNSDSMATNSSSSDRPVMTSGMTSGADTAACSTEPCRGSAEAHQRHGASVPNTVAIEAAMAAIWRLSQAAPRIWGSRTVRRTFAARSRPRL